jgi:hypothetical protein
LVWYEKIWTISIDADEWFELWKAKQYDLEWDQDLKQKKMQELNNMTLAEIEDLRQKKMQEINIYDTRRIEIKTSFTSLNMAGISMAFDSPNGPEFMRKYAS